jgi:UDP-N-acetylmuramyl pentapeptide phosphotransferase/UDP-N-acetylglucosamine-1-phosphate transferase
MGESMEQTFSDLCRERRAAGEGLFGFVLWTFTDTFVGILREDGRSMTQTAKRYGQILLSVAAALAIIGTALLTRNTENEGAFFYVLAIYFVLMGALEVYSRNKRNSP